MKNTNYNVLSFILHNFYSIPKEFHFEKRFCLWKYEIFDKITLKPLKKPYGIDSYNKVIPSLKEKKYWLGLLELKKMNVHVAQEYGLGLVLSDGPYTVIDIDNYQKYPPLDKLLISLFDKGAYIEISPSGKGLHIFFIGQWHSKKCKGDKQIILQDSNVKTSCEIYGGQDIRFITLTGFKLFNKDQVSLPLAKFNSISEELRSLEAIFFSVLESDYKKSFSLTNFSSNYLKSQFNQIKNNIINSKYAEHFINLCNSTNLSYRSPSEADWHFCLIVAQFINFKLSFNHKVEIIEYFFFNARKSRNKNYRTEYVRTTIQKVLRSYHKILSVSSKNLYSDSINVGKNKKSQINKNSIIRICNTMNIFHLGRSNKSFEYCNNIQDNYLKATFSRGLNYTDLKYYMELLFQYLDAADKFSDIKFAQSQFLPVNINLILKKLNISNGGKSYYDFEKSLNKLSDVTLVYNKKITADGIRSIHKEALISYKILYQHSRKKNNNDFSTSWRKLAIKMHPIILEISKQATYNYSLFNKESYNKIMSDKLKLLYYFFCCLTFPGCSFVEISIDDLLLLWPKTTLKQVVRQRKKEIVYLLQDFVELSCQFDDLELSLNYRDGKLIGLYAKKRKLKLF